MNIKKNFKRFWTLDRHHAAGFTLVELIVVIAILAILAGIAIPAYSGYVKKAERAGDEQLLAAVNTAFAAACIDNGFDSTAVDDAELSVDDNGVIGTSTSTFTANATTTVTYLTEVILKSGDDVTEAVNASFDVFFNGNENSTFKVFRVFRFQNGAFVGYTSEEAAALGGIFSEIFASLDLVEYVTRVNGSTFGTIGAEGLMVRVDDVTGLATELLKTPLGAPLKNALASTTEQQNEIAQAMGLKDADELQTLIASKNEEGDTDYFNRLLANYAVLQVAETTANSSASTLLNDLKSGMTTTEIKNMMDSEDAEASKEGVAKAAMMYAMYTAYANQLGDGDEKAEALANLESIDTFVAAISDATKEGSGFQTYLSNPQATTDMEGYMAAMNIIANSTEGNPEATRDLMENGYNNLELINALQGLLGK